MDENKLAKLKEIDYKIRDTCHNCKHFKQTSDKFFGECLAHHYTHKKHTGEARQLSVYLGGTCNEHEFANEDLMMLHSFKQFIA